MGLQNGLERGLGVKGFLVINRVGNSLWGTVIRT